MQLNNSTFLRVVIAATMLLPVLLLAQLEKKQSIGSLGVSGELNFGTATTYIFNEDCEGTGTPSGWTDVSGGTIYWDNTTNALAGSQSLVLSADADYSIVQYDHTAADTVYLRFKFHKLANHNNRLVNLNTQSGDTEFATVQLDEAGQLQISHGSATASTTDAMLENTTYNVWVRYSKGTGSDGVMSLGFSTDGTRPTNGNKFCSLSNGTSTSQCDRIKFMQLKTTGDANWYFDNLQASTMELGSW